MVLVRREYYRKWREKNRDRIKAYNRAYWERRALLEQQRAMSDASRTETETRQDTNRA